MNYAPDEITEMMGIGSYVGEIREGPDGGIYQWNEEEDGLGNIHGWWSSLKKKVKKYAGKALRNIPGVGPVRSMAKRLCRTLPKLRPILSRVPVVAPYYRIGMKVCGALKKVGLAGEDGEIMQAQNGQHYEVIQGIGEYGEAVAMARPVNIIIRGQMTRTKSRPQAQRSRSRRIKRTR